MKTANKIFIYLIIIAGCALLYLSLKLSALYFFIFLACFIIYIIAKKSRETPANKRFLITTVILIFVSRFILSLFVFSARGCDLSQDEGLYSKRALIKAYQMNGAREVEKGFREYFLDCDMRESGYGYNAYTYLLSGFYFLFGYQIQAARMINVFLNIISFLFIFYLSRNLFNSNTARISSFIFAIFPSITLWSAMIGIDTFMFLGIIAYIFSLIKLIRKVELKWLLIMIISFLMIASIRRYIMVILLTVTLVTAFLKIFTRMTQKGKTAIFLTGLLLFIMLLRLPVAPFLRIKWEEAMEVILRRQAGLAVIDDSGYYLYPAHCYAEQKCSLTDIAGAYVKGMRYVLLSPFPWKIESKLQFLAYPQVVLWYFMMPFVVYGFYVGFKTNRFATIIILLYSFFVFSLFALVAGNVGALFRHKDMVMPFLIIYFGAGLNRLIGKDEYTSL